MTQEHKFLGWSVIIMLAIIPVILLLALGQSGYTFSYSDVTHRLGQLASLIGVTLFALTFILAMRLRFVEDAFGGLDKVYKVHGIIGGAALVLLMMHPVLLVLKFVPGQMDLAARYLLPSSFWSVNFGIIALTGLVSLIFVTLYTKIRYNYWKVSHKFLGAVFIIAVFHMFLVRQDAARDFIFKGYPIYITVVAVIGISAFIYSSFIKSSSLMQVFYTVGSIRKKGGVFELGLVPEDNNISFAPGQFVFVRFYSSKVSREAHPFSITSCPDDPTLCIIIKNLGDFTGRMNYLKAGDRVAIEGPYGRFSSGGMSGYDQVWLAGGIGITPFLSMAEELNRSGVKQRVDLYYSVRAEDDFVGLDILHRIARANKNFRVITWVSNKSGHLTLKQVSEMSNGLERKDFFICGPAAFKDSLRNSILASGVDTERIHEEEFELK